jgi:hypothetical protein
MLFVLSGSSGSGKTTLAREVIARAPRIEVRELGEIASEPWNRERSGLWWRRDLTERWIQHAVELEAEGIDLLVTELVLGEVLAAPSAPNLLGIAACLLHCDDDETVRRIRARGEIDDVELGHFLNWSHWLAGHYDDPQFWLDPILSDEDTRWSWARWRHWTRGDPRWSVLQIDTTDEPVETSVGRLLDWIEDQRRRRASGRLALSGRWWDA